MPEAPWPLTLADRCRSIELLVVDVDGVLTAGEIAYSEGASDEFREWKAFHVRDGSALVTWRRLGKKAAILSGRRSRLVEVRAAELDLGPVVQAAGDKGAALEKILRATGATAETTAGIGDDLPDLPMLRGCRLAVAVADACPDARAVAHHVTRREGGRGAVREVIELILRCQGLWPGQ
jgi:3-deoxy-D-manno-octulosonate 8-phosphate phosphatase (KDO 8-P phosphatase)